MSMLELGGKYREMYTGFENIEVPCMVILMLSRNRFFTGNYHVMHVMYSLRSQIFVFLEILTSDYIRSKMSESTL